jgi:hypothetical protein
MALILAASVFGNLRYGIKNYGQSWMLHNPKELSFYLQEKKYYSEDHVPHYNKILSYSCKVP